MLFDTTTGKGTNRRTKCAVAAVLAISCIGYSSAQDPSPYSQRDQARAIVKQFAQQLKPKLIQIMQADGPVAAIQVCATEAPLMAANLSQQTGWQIKRVSLKARNQTTAIPDDWERQVLKSFDKSAANNAPTQPLFAERQSDREYRFMQAQPVEALCLHCHGSNLTPSIKNVLAETYPNDIATGYHIGEIRGAFSLRKEISQVE